MTKSADLEFEAKMRRGFDELPQADFEAWRSSHRDTVAYLNPVITANYVRQRRLFLRFASGAVAAAVVFVVALWAFTPQKFAFAQTIETINRAKTIRWSIVTYDRLHSVDGNRSWLKRGNRWERSYLAPNKWRDVRYDDDGSVAFVTIEDSMTGERLMLNMKEKTATLSKEPSGQFGRGGPFDGIETILKGKSIEFVGQQIVDGIPTNVFRHQREFNQGKGESIEIWLDAESKSLVKYCTTPGNEYFDPETAFDRNHVPEELFSYGEIAGVINRDIEFDAQLDPSLFNLKPPAGFTVVEPPQRAAVTEDLMIQWLQLTAAANGDIFLELERGFNLDWHNAIANKPILERTEAEQKYMEVAYEYILDGNRNPVQEFVNKFTESKRFRYLGKGIKLGSKDRIVCFYKLKSTGRYRAVYGDLSVQDMNPEDLPLPVE